MQIYWTTIKDIIDETSEVKTYLLEIPEGFTWEEGAHTHLALKGFNEGEQPNRGLVRHMSISTLPHEQAIGITTRIKELCSPYKSTLKNYTIGDEVALFKTHSNVPLQRVGKKLYLLSSGVGVATFRPLILDYLANTEGIPHMHSLNVDSTQEFLFNPVFEATKDYAFTAQFVDNRPAYYEEVSKLATDKDALFYVVGSDEFLNQTIAVLKEALIDPSQIIIDKHPHMRDEFLS